MLILIWLLIAIICCMMARSRNRNPLLGFIGGAIFGVFSVIYYLVVGDKTKA